MNRMAVMGAIMNMDQGTQGEGELKDMNRMGIMGANMKGVIMNMAKGTQGEGEVKDMNRMIVNIFSRKN